MENKINSNENDIMGKIDDRIGELEKLLLAAGSDEEKIPLLDELVGFFFYKKEYDKSIACAKNLLEVSTNANNLECQADAFFRMGSAFMALKDYNKAFESYESALEIYRTMDNKLTVAACCMQLASLHTMKQEWDKTFNYYKEAEEIFINENNYKQLTIISNTIGSIYLYKGVWDNALEYFLKSVINCLKTKSVFSLIHFCKSTICRKSLWKK